MSEKTEVLLFGLGAVGAFYSYILGNNENVSLSVVARSNHDVVKNKGLRIESETHGKQEVRIDHVYKDPFDAGKTFDYVVICNKAINIDSAPTLFKSVVGRFTTFVLIQNGVGNEDPFRAYYSQNTILSVVAWVNCQQIQPEVIQHKTLEETEIGLFHNKNLTQRTEQQRLDLFVNLLKLGGTNVTTYDNIQQKRWEKVIWNAAWNSISAITSCSAQFWLDSSPEATTIMKRLMREMVQAAKADNVELSSSLPDDFVQRMAKLQGIYGSMYVDMISGRPLEVEVIVGNPLRKAREAGVDCPLLECFYGMVRAVDGRVRAIGDGEKNSK